MGGFYMAYLESTLLIHYFGNKKFSKPLEFFIRFLPGLLVSPRSCRKGAKPLLMFALSLSCRLSGEWLQLLHVAS
jgi:hypothetical protein